MTKKEFDIQIVLGIFQIYSQKFYDALKTTSDTPLIECAVYKYNLIALPVYNIHSPISLFIRAVLVVSKTHKQWWRKVFNSDLMRLSIVGKKPKDIPLIQISNKL